MSAMSVDVADTSLAAPAPTGLRRRVAAAGLLFGLVVALLLGVPGLRPVAEEIRQMPLPWVALAVVLELLSCLSFVVVFRLFFDGPVDREARTLAWTSMASGALLPGGGVGGLAITGWLMSLRGVSASWIVRRSSGLFFLTSAVNGAVIVGAGVALLISDPSAGDLVRAGLPVVLASMIVLLVVTAPWLGERLRATRDRRALAGVLAGIRDARGLARRPNWRMLGALGYLGFDIAVLWATLNALGDAPPVAALMLGYTVGYLANALPVPGGVGVLDGGLTAGLLLYGAAGDHVAAAVLVYHAIAVWLPGLGGLLAYGTLRRTLVDSDAPVAATVSGARTVGSAASWPLPKSSKRRYAATSAGSPTRSADRTCGTSCTAR